MRRFRQSTAARRAHSLAPPDRWLLSYADFVTLLLAVFVVLLASVWHNERPLGALSTAIHSGFEELRAGAAQPTPSAATSSLPKPQQATSGKKPPAPQVDVDALKRELGGIFGEAIARDEIVLQQTPDGLIISLRELGLFNSGEATLLPGAADKLRRAAVVLMQHGFEIRVEGHSDDQPIHSATFESNWQLSTARAMSVLQLLLEGAGFPPERLSVAGYGPYHPVADNITAEGRRMNRRVDLVVVAPRSREENLP